MDKESKEERKKEKKEEIELIKYKWEFLRRNEEYQKDYEQYIWLNKSAACKEKIRRKYGIDYPQNPELSFPEFSERIRRRFPLLTSVTHLDDFLRSWNISYYDDIETCRKELELKKHLKKVERAKLYEKIKKKTELTKLKKELEELKRNKSLNKVKEKIWFRIKLINAFEAVIRSAWSETSKNPEYNVVQRDTDVVPIPLEEEELQKVKFNSIMVGINIYKPKFQIMKDVEKIIDYWKILLKRRSPTPTEWLTGVKQTGETRRRFDEYERLLKIWDLRKEKYSFEKIARMPGMYKFVTSSKDMADTIKKAYKRAQTLIKSDYERIK